MPLITMTLKILLPFRVFTEQTMVTRFLAETREGSVGFLPHRLDGVAALEPGILIYEQHQEREKYVALDEGVLVKNGLHVLISVRNAIAGTDLRQLRNAVNREFLTLDEDEQHLRSMMAKLESSFMRQMVDFRHA